MNKQTEALKMAQAALAASDDFLFNYHDCEPNNEREVDAYSEIRANNMKAWEAIREALAEQPAQQQEPVAVARVDDLERGGRVRALAMGLSLDAPLYTSPPASKPWVGLTDEEIDKLPWEPHEGNPMTFAEGLRYFARAIEAAHGITGEQHG